jgi:hypothetical protein
MHRILIVFGIYDHTNDKCLVIVAKRRTVPVSRLSKKSRFTFLIQVSIEIFIVVDNSSIYRSKKVIEKLKQYYPRITVFLLTISPELLISTMDGCRERQLTFLHLQINRHWNGNK